jgi:hypothetical protein
MAEEHDLEDRRPAVGRCQACCEKIAWESVADHLGERWLAVCRCGRIQVFLPDGPGVSPDDPLTEFLVGPEPTVRPASPPWIRLFLRSLREQLADWRYDPAVCPACANTVRFWLQASPRPSWLATCTLCLACGRVTSEYSQPWRNYRELPACGDTWAPACPAVQRLRDCVLRPFARPASPAG